MATTPTNKPIPSEDPRDLKFNAGKIDDVVTSYEHYYTDRFGVRRWTIAGFQYTAEEAIRNYGYITMDSFEDGATLTLPNQILRYEATGEYYRFDGDLPKTVPAGSTPETSGGVGLGAWVSVGDASLRSDLAGDSGYSLIGEADSFAALSSITPMFDGARIKLRGYHAGSSYGGGDFIGHIGAATADGGMTAVGPGFYWKRLAVPGELNFSYFGAIGDGIADDSDALQNAFNYVNACRGATLFGDSGKRYRVTRKIFVYQNTLLDLNFSTILRDFDTSATGTNTLALIYASSSIYSQKLVVKNGIFDNQGDIHHTQANIWELLYAYDVSFDNCTFLDVAGGHAIDLGFIKTIRVNNCKFLGYKDWVGNRNFSEAIQIETPLFADNNVDVQVTGCYFGPSASLPSWAVGVGNHGSIDGAPPCVGIVIEKNTFDANTYAGVRGFSRWESVKIDKNIFKNFTLPAIIFTGRKVSPTLQETSRSVKITGNDFVNCTGDTTIVALAPTIETGTAGSRLFHRDWTVSGNTFDGNTGVMIDMRFVDGLKVGLNECINGGGVFLRGDYVADVAVIGNVVDTQKAIFYFTETDGAYLGTGLSRKLIVSGNHAKNGLRGVHINCLFDGFSVTGNNFSAITGTAVLAADTGAKNGVFSGNTYTGTIGTELFTDVTGSCSNVVTIGNVHPTANPDRNLATSVSFSGLYGAGSPEGVQRATLGSHYVDTTTGSFYIKTTGGGAATGWTLK